MYGNVKDKLSALVPDFRHLQSQSRTNTKIINPSFLEDADFIMQNEFPRNPQDSRMKNLEDIYTKVRPTTNMSRSRLKGTGRDF